MLLLFQNIYKYFFRVSWLCPMHFNHTHPCSLFPAPLRPHHHYSFPHILFCSLLNPLSWICAAHIHWNMNSLLGLHYWEKFDSPSMSSSHLPIALQLCLLSSSVIHAGVFDSVMYRICLGIHGFCDYMCTMILPLTADRQSPSITSHLHVI